MKSYPREVMSWVIAAGVLDCLGLIVAVFGQLVNVTTTHPVLSAASLVLGGALLAVLVAAAALDEPRSRREVLGR